jgi:hypothetical protein
MARVHQKPQWIGFKASHPSSSEIQQPMNFKSLLVSQAVSVSRPVAINSYK